MPSLPRVAEFITSAADAGGFPPPGPPEIAFAGRSNVGKSSLLNALTGRHGLARTSSTPGCTRLLNWFRVVTARGELRFVDLPGYGYARVGKSTRAGFGPLIDGYLTGRDVLRLVVVLLDARRGPEDEERDLLPWLAEHDRPALVVLTKADKLTKAERKPAAAAVRRDLGLQREPLLFSATDEMGVAELWRAIHAAAFASPASVG